VQIKSAWPVHELGATLRGSYFAYDNLPSLNRPSADTKVMGRYDFNRDLRFEGEGRFLLGTDNPGSPNLQADLVKLPIFTTWGATAGLAQRFNRLDLAVKGSVDRTTFQNSELTDGTSVSNEDRNYNQYRVQGRVSYEFTPRAEAVRRDRCRQAHSRQRGHRQGFTCSDTQGRRDLRVAALPDRRGFRRLYQPRKRQPDVPAVERLCRRWLASLGRDRSDDGDFHRLVTRRRRSRVCPAR